MGEADNHLTDGAALMSNQLPKLTEFRDRYVRIMEPFVTVQCQTKEDLKDLKQEFDSAFKEEFDRETRGIQWAGLALNAKRHFADKEKLEKARLKAGASEQYDLFAA